MDTAMDSWRQFKATPNSRDTRSHLSGSDAEALACSYLETQGLKLIQRNFRTRRGEIDLIMQDNQTLVFVEVRFRRSERFGSAEESITPQKCGRLTAAGLAYMQRQHYNNDTVARFDAVAIKPDSSSDSGFALNWVRHILG